jgi:Glycosyl transferase family 2
MDDETATPAAPLVSVLCLTYNHADFVGQALDSFLAQVTTFDVEVVVSDDCSSDGTADIAQSCQSRFGSRLRVLRSPVNLGVTRNFRRALKACRGKYVALCEGDDFWRGPDKLQAQVDFLEAHPDYVMAYHDATIVDPSGDHGASQLPPRLRCDASSAELIATRPISTLTVCFRNLLGDLPPELDQAPALDLCLWSLLGQHGKGKYLTTIEPAGYRVHSGGVFSTQTDKNRHLMTAQSLLCLSRVYARQGRHKASNDILMKAIRLACVPLGPAANLRLWVSGLGRLFISALRASKRRLLYRRQVPDVPSPGP